MPAALPLPSWHSTARHLNHGQLWPVRLPLLQSSAVGVPSCYLDAVAGPPPAQFCLQKSTVQDSEFLLNCYQQQQATPSKFTSKPVDRPHQLPSSHAAPYLTCQ